MNYTTKPGAGDTHLVQEEGLIVARFFGPSAEKYAALFMAALQHQEGAENVVESDTPMFLKRQAD